MKAILVLTFLFMIILTGHSQLTKTEVIKGNFQTFELDNGQTKYLDYSNKNNVVNIYNIDHTIWKTVNIPLTKGHALDKIKHISTNLFNQDDQLEIVYTSVEYNTEDYGIESAMQFQNNITYSLNIINEKGDILLEEKNSNNYDLIDSGEINKLRVHKHLNLDAESETIVYNIQ